MSEAPSGAGATAPSTKWGDPVRFLTDDRDAKERHELVIQRGGNGDWYVSVVPEGHRTFRGVRICTSGGAAREVPGLGLAIANAYRAMLKAGASESGEQAPPSPICTDKQCQKFDAYHRVGQFGCSAGVRAGEATAPTPALDVKYLCMALVQIAEKSPFVYEEGQLCALASQLPELLSARARLSEAERERDAANRRTLEVSAEAAKAPSTSPLIARIALLEKQVDDERLTASLASATAARIWARWQQALEAVEKAQGFEPTLTGHADTGEWATMEPERTGTYIDRDALAAHLRSLSHP